MLFQRPSERVTLLGKGRLDGLVQMLLRLRRLLFNTVNHVGFLSATDETQADRNPLQGTCNSPSSIEL